MLESGRQTPPARAIKKTKSSVDCKSESDQRELFFNQIAEDLQDCHSMISERLIKAGMMGSREFWGFAFGSRELFEKFFGSCSWSEILNIFGMVPENVLPAHSHSQKADLIIFLVMPFVIRSTC